jgi:hypothetical protein
LHEFHWYFKHLKCLIVQIGAEQNLHAVIGEKTISTQYKILLPSTHTYNDLHRMLQLKTLVELNHEV